MNLRKVLMVSAAAVVLSSGAAIAGEDNGFYVGVGAGLSLPQDTEIKGSGNKTDIDLENGAALKAAVGYKINSNWRAEVEVSRHNNDNDSSASQNGEGEITTYGLMGNVYYDFNLESKFTPYLGGGLGFAWLDPDGIRPLNGGQGTLSENTNDPAYQLMAGVAYNINEALDATLEYRFFGTRNHGARTSNAVSVKSDYHSHDLMLGLNWYFGRTFKAIEEKKAVFVPSNYLVFFDFDKAEVSPEAKEIITKAASDYKEKGLVRIELTGHTDRAGTENYNQKLSKTRAKAVSEELAKMGIGDKNIAVYAKGESVPLVPTPDGIREPQNRRVEIILK